MTLWIDAQLSPALASWVTQTFNIQAVAVRELGMRDATDPEIFEAARKAKAAVLTKDRDFVHLLDRLGPPAAGGLANLWQYQQRASPPTPCTCFASGLSTA